MNGQNRFLVLVVGITMLAVLSAGTNQGFAQFAEPVPQWIWSPEHTAGHVPKSSCFFRRFLRLNHVTSASLAVAADDSFELYINGRRIGEGTSEQGIATFDVTEHVKVGANLIAIRVSNHVGGTAGLATRLVVQGRPGQAETSFVSDATWRTSLNSLPLWNRAAYSDRRWQPARSIGMFSDFVVRQRNAQVRASRSAAGSTAKKHSPKSQSRRLTRLPASGQQLDVPREFRLEQIAGHQDVGSLTAMTFNEQGHLIAARENGTLLLLRDQGGQGQFTSVREYGRLLKNCQGLLAMNGDVFAIGEGAEGSALYRLADSQGNGLLDQATAIVKLQGTNLEHGPHGMVLGSDGMIYVVVGNHSTLARPAADTSPYRHAYDGDLVRPKVEDPGGHAAGMKSPGGFVFRTDLRGSRVEIVAGGLRNAYDLAIDEHGEIFTHDSDMESDEGTPWFRPTRVYHVIAGADFGWRSGWSKWPDYYIDSVPPAADTGRGSPTGMVFYDHQNFPDEYRHSLFSCDWSEGRILVMKMREDGASFQTTPATFIQGEPLNVTDIEVGPDGGLYFSTGGRGTAGNIYRVTWKGHIHSPKSLGSGLDRALRQPQLNSSWARQNVAKLRQSIASNWMPRLAAAALDKTRPADERVQAVRIMHWMDRGPGLDLALNLSRDENIEIRRQAAYSLGMSSDAAAAQRLIQLLTDDDAVVRRRACESLARSGQVPSLDQLRHLFASPDRAQTWAARRLLERIPLSQWRAQLLETDDVSLFLHGATATLVAQPDTQVAQAILERTMKWMEGFINDTNFIYMLRVQQLALLRGELKPDSMPRFSQQIAEEYPSSSQIINRELMRLITYLQATAVMDRCLAELESDMPSSERAHLAIHLTRLQSGWTTERKLSVFQHLETESGSGNGLSGYLQTVAREFGKTLTDPEIARILEQGHQWPGAAQAALLHLPEQLTDAQFELVKALDTRLASQNGETLKRLKLAIVAVLARDKSPRSFAYLREVDERDPARRVEIALGLAEKPSGENWDIVVRGLTLLDKSAARHVLMQLKKQTQTPAPGDSNPYRQVILAAQRLGDDGADQAIELLEHWQGFVDSKEDVPWSKKITAWQAWYVEQFPDDPAPEPTVISHDGHWDYESLLGHLTQAEQHQEGSIEKGKHVFAKADCAKCHRFADQGESMGPDLTGLSRRFLKREILEAIVYPSKVISDQYSAKIVTTVNGQTYVGIVARGTAGQLSVLQSNGEQVRIPEGEVDEIEPSRTSAMPEGTLDRLTLQEITDLFAYLSSGNQRLTRRNPPARNPQ